MNLTSVVPRLWVDRYCHTFPTRKYLLPGPAAGCGQVSSLDAMEVFWRWEKSEVDYAYNRVVHAFLKVKLKNGRNGWWFYLHTKECCLSTKTNPFSLDFFCLLNRYLRFWIHSSRLQYVGGTWFWDVSLWHSPQIKYIYSKNISSWCRNITFISSS